MTVGAYIVWSLIAGGCGLLLYAFGNGAGYKRGRRHEREFAERVWCRLIREHPELGELILDLAKSEGL